MEKSFKEKESKVHETPPQLLPLSTSPVFDIFLLHLLPETFAQILMERGFPLWLGLPVEEFLLLHFLALDFPMWVDILLHLQVEGRQFLF